MNYFTDGIGTWALFHKPLSISLCLLHLQKNCRVFFMSALQEICMQYALQEIYPIITKSFSKELSTILRIQPTLIHTETIRNGVSHFVDPALTEQLN